MNSVIDENWTTIPGKPNVNLYYSSFVERSRSTTIGTKRESSTSVACRRFIIAELHGWNMEQYIPWPILSKSYGSRGARSDQIIRMHVYQITSSVVGFSSAMRKTLYDRVSSIIMSRKTCQLELSLGSRAPFWSFLSFLFDEDCCFCRETLKQNHRMLSAAGLGSGAVGPVTNRTCQPSSSPFKFPRNIFRCQRLS